MKASFVISLLLITGLSSVAYGQQAKLEGHVFDDKDARVSTVRIIALGGQAAETDSRGHFVVAFPDAIKPGQATRIEAVKPNWVIYEPMLGNCVTQSSARNYEPLKVIIVPKGSPVALSPKRLGSVIARWANERAKLQTQIEKLTDERDEYAFLREYSEKYGFTLEQFINAGQQWAQAKDSDDKEEQALKRYFLKDYERAAQLARESALAAADELEQADKQRTEASLKVIRRFKLEGNALYEQSEFRKALRAYGEIETRFSKRKLSKEDLMGEWADIKNLVGYAKMELGIRVEGEESRTLLSESVGEYRQALSAYTRELLPEQWARTQTNLGCVLSEQGKRLGGEEGARLLGQSVQTFRQALTVRTRVKLPQDWAATQADLGVALWSQGERVAGEEGVRLLGQSVEAYHQALTVLTLEQQPRGWAMAKNNLGLVLLEQAGRLGRAEALRLLGQAAENLRAALQVHTLAQMPQQWAMTQNNLGLVLYAEGERRPGDEGVRLLEQAVESYRQALQVRTREQFPQDWAKTQNNLGNALSVQGERVTGAEGVRLLGQAVEALRAILQVQTREHLPQDWAIAQNNLGVALYSQGVRLAGGERIRLLVQAVEAHLAALQVQTREHLPLAWARSHQNLGRTYLLFRNWPAAAESYSNVLVISPDNEEIHRALSELYQDRLFKFEKAYALNQQWLARRPDDLSAQANLAEECFSTGRFPECGQRISALLTKPGVAVDTKVALRAIEIADLLAMGQTNQVPAKMEALIADVSSQPAEFKVEWSFEGTKRFIGQNEKLAPYRSWLEQLFAALASPTRDQIIKGLNETKASFK